jgi:hypothetical protein
MNMYENMKRITSTCSCPSDSNDKPVKVKTKADKEYEVCPRKRT